MPPKKFVPTENRSPNRPNCIRPDSGLIHGHLLSMNGYHDDLIQRGKLLSRKDSNLFE